MELWCFLFFAGSYYDANLPSLSRQIRENAGYKFINPLLECDVAEGTISAPKINFSKSVNSYTDTIKSSLEVTSIAYYYRDLNNGPTFGADLDEGFIPASLLKLPVAMAYYRYSEKEPGIFDKKITYSHVFEEGSAGNAQLIPQKVNIELGKEYTVEELIYHVLTYSDNQAVSLLYDNLPPEYIRSLYERLGLSEDVLNGPGATLTVKEYSVFLRMLFNASYLSRDNSEQLLGLLSTIDFKDALRAGVPPYVLVSHKFGEAGFLNGDKQLHDCGIVYYPKHPYLLCVMSKGKNLDNLKTAIKETSQKVFEEVNAQYKLIK